MKNTNHTVFMQLQVWRLYDGTSATVTAYQVGRTKCSSRLRNHRESSQRLERGNMEACLFRVSTVLLRSARPTTAPIMIKQQTKCDRQSKIEIRDLRVSVVIHLSICAQNSIILAHLPGFLLKYGIVRCLSMRRALLKSAYDSRLFNNMCGQARR